MPKFPKDIITGTGLVSVIRAKDSSQLVDVALALHKGGCKAIELTMTTPNALSVLEKTISKLPSDEVTLGVGTVLDPETARAAILSGADFIVSPTLNVKVIELCRRYSKVVVPGAFSPTEILTAWEAGADFVKLFPATAVGPGYIQDIHGPLPQIKIIPTGGVDVDNAADFIKAGAEAVAAGSSLVKKSFLASGDMDGIAALAAQFIRNIQTARQK
ncbi:MAG TPA: bifunctional 4-hydroxy-2-oxoglutarate aldolase/2-dehydro-3-deoxy-phosphogluconate aldolase [Candidatus Brocadiia bacterium]|nr:bifunctional 4-hydroxy-2-oxoglutarate aldolase/2-dehydro-3-deoxy-phosphogluconate aldolase [Candidatus Brocadiia bacterium]